MFAPPPHIFIEGGGGGATAPPPPRIDASADTHTHTHTLFLGHSKQCSNEPNLSVQNR